MDFKLPDEILEEFHKRVDHGIFGYSDPLDDYYEALNHWFSTRHGFTVKPEWVTILPGVVMALATCVSAFTKPGDNVIIISPVYDPFYSIVGNNGRNIVTSSLVFKDGKVTIPWRKEWTLDVFGK